MEQQLLCAQRHVSPVLLTSMICIPLVASLFLYGLLQIALHGKPVSPCMHACSLWTTNSQLTSP